MKRAEITLGQVISYNNARWRVVRIVDNDTCLFETEEGWVFEETQSYAQLMGEKGEVEFLLFEDNVLFKKDYTGPACDIKALGTKEWRR